LAASLALGAPTLADSEYLIDSWETDQGLPENSATAMVQTPDGYLWFGTFNGLVRFDGVKFAVFDPSNTPELPSPGIVNLHLDASHRLWVSTYRGLVVGEPHRWTTFRHVPAWTGDYVRTFSESAGVLCATSFDGKVFRARDGRLEELPEPPGKKGEGYLGCVDRLGRIWVAQWQARYFGRWDGRQWQLSDLAGTLFPDLEGLTRLRNGNLLLVRARELVQFDGEHVVSRLPLPPPYEMRGLWSVNEDHQGTVWICSQSSGLYRVQPSGAVRHFTATNGLTYDGLRFAFEDREHDLWVGSGGGGLMRFKSRTFVAYGQENGLSERNVKAVLEEAPGRILIGTYGRGLFLWDGERTSVPETIRQPFTRHAQCLLRDPDLNLWVGGYNGLPNETCLTILTPAGRRAVPPAESGGISINALFRDSRGRIWIGGRDGVAVFKNGQFTPPNPANVARLRDVCCFAEDLQRGAIWAAGPEGLNQFADGQWREVKDPAGGPLRDILCLRSEPDGSLWIGEAGVGLLRLQQDHWSSVTEVHGLPTRNICCVIQDDHGYWWLGSNRGVIRARKLDVIRVADGVLADLPCQVFNLSDGLPSVECASGYQSTASKDSQGRIWFATIKGLAMVDPARIDINTNPPPVRLEGISYLERAGRQVALSARELRPARDGLSPNSRPLLTIPPGSRQLEARFAALSLVAPEKVRLKYRLVQNGKTVLSGEGAGRTVSSQWLPPGTYLLRVTAANNDGVWNDEGAMLAFVVQPFYWQTLWFRLLLAVGFGGSVAASVGKLHLNRLRRTEELLRQQRALAVERARSAALTQYASDIIMLLNSEGLVIYESPSTSRILGYAEGYLLGKDPIEFVHPDDQSTTRLAPRGLAQDRNPAILVTFRFRHAQGHWVELESLATNLLNHPGVQGIMVTMRDVTERKRVEAEVQRLKNYLANIIDSMPSILVATDMAKVVTEWNRQAEIATGVAASKAIGQPITALLPDFSPWIEPLFDEVLQRRPASREKLVLIKNGERHFYDLMMYPLAADNLQGAVLRIENVTERMRIQELMVQTEKMVSVGGLAAGMAHEINNPLGIISQAAQNIERRVSADLAANRKIAEELGIGMEALQAYFQRREIPQFIRDIREASARASRIVANMLQFSRRSQASRQPVALAEVVERTVELASNDYDLKKRYDFRSIEILREYDAGLPAVPLVAAEMEQVLLNLIKNAAQAMDANPPERKPRIILRLKREEPYAVVEVEDNGPGMEEAVLRRVFEPFFTSKPPGVGTGLGLSVSYTIVTQNHKGLITVDSTPGQGARFTIRLPLK
jgi:PAS domain S-box-containing protein